MSFRGAVTDRSRHVQGCTLHLTGHQVVVLNVKGANILELQPGEGDAAVVRDYSKTYFKQDLDLLVYTLYIAILYMSYTYSASQNSCFESFFCEMTEDNGKLSKHFKMLPF